MRLLRPAIKHCVFLGVDFHGTTQSDLWLKVLAVMAWAKSSGARRYVASAAGDLGSDAAAVTADQPGNIEWELICLRGRKIILAPSWSELAGVK
jgi:hypothetical protein